MIHCRRCAALCRAGGGVTVGAAGGCDSPPEECWVVGDAGGFWGEERGSRVCSVAPSVPEADTWGRLLSEMALNWPLRRIGVLKGRRAKLDSCFAVAAGLCRDSVPIEQNCFGRWKREREQSWSGQTKMDGSVRGIAS
jgi:hypothetical protein